MCQPIPLAQAQGESEGLAVDDTYAFWASQANDTILRIKKDGTETTPTVLAHDQAGNVYTPFVVAIDTNNVYWTNDLTNDPTNPGLVARCAKTGCNGVGTRITSHDLDYPEGLAVDDTYVYFSELYMWTVGRANKLDAGSFGYLVTQIQNVGTLALDDASVYFSGTDQAGDNTVARIPKSAATGIVDAAADVGQTYQHLAPLGVFAPNSLALDTNTIFWTIPSDTTTNPTGLIQSAPKGGVGDGGQPVTLSTTETNPIFIVVDATNVYWTALGTNSAADPVNDYPIYVDSYIATCPKAACPASGPVVLTRGISWSGFIALDANAIYYTFRGNSPNEGGLMKLAKP
jgi:hypothetical protein